MEQKTTILWKKVCWRKEYCLLLLSCIALLFLVQSVSATDSDTRWARWKLKVNFVDNDINALWTVQVLSGEQVLDARNFTIPCQTVGNVTIENGVAHMNGGYITCVTGNFRNVAASMSPGVMLPETCQYKDAWTKMVGKPNFALSNIHPVFFQPDADIKYSIAKVTGAPEVMTRLRAGDMVIENSGPLTSNHIVAGSRINECNGNTCEAKHWVNGVLIATTEIPQDLPTMSTGPVSVLIGKDNHHVYRGILEEAEGDPGCPGVPLD